MGENLDGLSFNGTVCNTRHTTNTPLTMAQSWFLCFHSGPIKETNTEKVVQMKSPWCNLTPLPSTPGLSSWPMNQCLVPPADKKKGLWPHASKLKNHTPAPSRPSDCKVEVTHLHPSHERSLERDAKLSLNGVGARESCKYKVANSLVRNFTNSHMHKYQKSYIKYPLLLNSLFGNRRKNLTRCCWYMIAVV